MKKPSLNGIPCTIITRKQEYNTSFRSSYVLLRLKNAGFDLTKPFKRLHPFDCYETLYLQDGDQG